MRKKVPVEKEKIIKAARSLFGKKGYEATSLREIAQAVNLNASTIYYYFKDKEEILFSGILAYGDSLISVLDRVVKAHTDPFVRLRQIMFNAICAIPDRKNAMRVFVEERGNLTKTHRNIIYRLHRKIYDTYMEQLLELKKRDLIRIKEREIAVAVFDWIGTSIWTYRWYKGDGKIPIDDVARISIDLFFHGILNDKGLSLYEKLNPL